MIHYIATDTQGGAPMITIAGGIILAVLFFAVLPYLIVAVGWALVIILTSGAVGIAVYMMWSWGQSDPTSLGVVCIAVGSILILRRLIPKSAALSEEEFRRKYPYLSAKLDKERSRQT